MTRPSIPTAQELFFSTAPVDPETVEVREANFFGAVRQSNGTYKYTYARRLDDLNDLIARRLPDSRPLLAMDVAVSSGVSTLEWSQSLDRLGVAHEIVAGDLNVSAYLVDVSPRIRALVDKTGYVLQYEFFGKAVTNPPRRRALPLFYPLIARVRSALRGVAPFVEPSEGDGAKRGGLSYRALKLVSPRLLAAPTIRVIEDDILQAAPEHDGRFDVVRAANILNRSYFDDRTLTRIIANLTRRLKPGGLLAVCSTTGDVFGVTNSPKRNDGTLFRKTDDGVLEPIERIGSGAEVEPLAIGHGVVA